MQQNFLGVSAGGDVSQLRELPGDVRGGGGGLGYGRFVVFPHSKVADYFFGKIQNSIFFFKNLIIKVPLKQ